MSGHPRILTNKGRQVTNKAMEERIEAAQG
jgi:hypothetical protein